MKAIKILDYEHYIIREFLDVLLRGAEGILSGKDPGREFFEKAVTFCREFADKAHHYKEEHVMFGLLAQKHDGKIDAQIEKHRLQHEQCRDLVHGMSVAIEGYARGEETGRASLHRNVCDYASTLRSHIRSEDEIFFPMVEVFLSDAEGEALLREFEKYEGKTKGRFSEEGRQLVQELSALL